MNQMVDVQFAFHQTKKKKNRIRRTKTTTVVVSQCVRILHNTRSALYMNKKK
jgi:hypothetical protein